jgi:hypothetical protein
MGHVNARRLGRIHSRFRKKGIAMRQLSVLLTLFVSAGVASAQFDDPQELARATIADAIKSTGIEGKGVRKCFRWKTKFTMEAFDKDAELHEVKVVQTVTIAFPFQYKEVKEMSTLGEKATATTIFDGKNGWSNFNGKINELEPIALKEFRQLSNVFEATYLLTTLLNNQKYKVTATRMVHVDGKRATEIRVYRDGFLDMKLCFDLRTNFLVKLERKALDPRFGSECKETRRYRNYQKIGGRMIPGSVAVLRDGELIYEMQTVEFTELDNVNPTEFAEPKR